MSVIPPNLLGVAIGGAIGALLRHWAGHVALAWMPEHTHRATLIVNVLGSLALGSLAAWALHKGDATPTWVRHGVMVGLLGAFTTFSAFSLDTLRLVHAGRLTAAAVYVLASVAICLLAVALGWWATQRFLPTSPPTANPTINTPAATAER